MNTVPNSQKEAKTTTPPPKGNGGVAGFVNNPILGGAGDAITSPRVDCGHTPSLSLGAVRVPTCAPGSGEENPATAQPIRILLSEAASKHLSEAGGDAFLVVGRGSWPEAPGRWVIYLTPCSVKTADAAIRVAQGKSKERKIRQTG